MGNKNKNDNKKKEFEIPKTVKALVKLNWKKFKKEEKNHYDSKKELKQAYYAEIIDRLPEAIALLVRYGHLESVKETKNDIYGKLTDPDFLKYLKKQIKEEDLEFENMVLIPAIVQDIVKDASKEILAEKEKNPDANITIDLSDVVELSSIILKKKMKKFKKAGIDEELAFDVLSTIPTEEILKNSQQYRIRALFSVLYEHAKTKEVNFAKVIECTFKKDDYIPSIITFALLERKEKISSFTDTQKKLFNDITEYCFRTMEEMKKDDIRSIIKAYVDSRKRDEAQNKDANRRYYISSLPEKDYEKILSVVDDMIKKDEDIKKYL